MTCLLNSMGRLTFNGAIDQSDLSMNMHHAEQQLRDTPDAVLLLEGGEDVYPSFYGQPVLYAYVNNQSRERDKRELRLIELACMYHVPIIGICRGHQLLAVSQGGTLYQDIETQANAHHHEYHVVECFDILADFTGPYREVNSYHHQAVQNIPQNAIPLAHAIDEINEALYYPSINAISVQWHPEFVDDFDLLNWMFIRLNRAITRYVPENRVYDRPQRRGVITS